MPNTHPPGEISYDISSQTHISFKASGNTSETQIPLDDGGEAMPTFSKLSQ